MANSHHSVNLPMTPEFRRVLIMAARLGRAGNMSYGGWSVLMETRWPQESQATSDEADIGVADFSELMARIYQGPLETPPGRRARTGPPLAAGELRDADPARGRERPPRAAVRARVGIRPGGAGRRRGVVQQLLLFARPVRRPAGRPRGHGRRRVRRHGLAVERAVQAVPEAAGRALYPRRRPAHGVGRRVPLPRAATMRRSSFPRATRRSARCCCRT